MPVMNRLRKRSETQFYSQQPQEIKHLGTDLLKEMKDLYEQNYRTMQKEIKEDTRRQKGLPCS
jgi:hypothetical protein